MAHDPVSPPPRIIGTAGHIDHGKSRLVLALTGVDPDRLPEEKARGITIDLGFAPIELPGGQHAAFVDVPGHERFVRTMVAGASGIDLALLVVALDEGPMPQTLEHLAVLELLGVERLVVALTKVDLVDDDWTDLVVAECRARLQGGPYKGAPLVPVSAVRGDGLDTLRHTLADVLAALPPRTIEGQARLAIDRAFTRPGFGTVVTGTLLSGRIRREDRLLLLPAGTEVRVRGLEVHGTARDEARAGERTALNLGGVGLDAVARGDVVAATGAAAATRVIAADVHLLPAAPALPSGRTVHLHAGTAETSARIVWLDTDRVGGGEDCGPEAARLHLLRPLALSAGDRFVLRAGAPLRTVGGGVVLDRQGQAYRRHRRDSLEALGRLRAGGPRGRVLAALARGGSRPQDAASLAAAASLDGESAGRVLGELHAEGLARPVPGGGWITAQAWQALEAEVLRAVGEYHRLHPLRPGAPREEVRRRATPGLDGRRFALAVEAWSAAGRLRADRERLALPGFEAAAGVEERRRLEAVLGRFADAAWNPPAVVDALSGIPDGDEYLALLAADGRLVRLGGGMYMHAGAVAEARNCLLALLGQGGVSAAQFRDALGISRRTAVPLLEHFDAARVTRRQGDLHVRAGGAERERERSAVSGNGTDDNERGGPHGS